MEEKEQNSYQIVNQLYIEAIKKKSQINNVYSLVNTEKLPHQLGSQYRQQKTLLQDQQGDELQHCQ